ncbi:intercellular adhesion molecule 5-like [Pelobates fuscus]|uniref:intercellular adhesion molecule 5-like n=1 Tax=Pelobates fuscus TaxID=191477 RepID=UPI002FE481D8
MELVWLIALFRIFIATQAQASLPEPILEVENNLEEGEEAIFQCTMKYAGPEEVNLEIRNKITKLDSCVQTNKPFPKVTCRPEITMDFQNMEIFCVARLEVRSKTKTLHVRSEPSFTDCPKDVTWVEGETKSFHCIAEGYPPPNVTCSKDSKTYMEGEKFTVTRSMAGLYSCRATNFDTTSKQVTVKVQFRPSVLNIKGPPNFLVSKDENVTLTCEAEGDPAPTYSWNTPTADVEISDDSRTVKIRGMKPAHVGRYTCNAQNKHGNGTKTERLTMAGYNRGQKSEQYWCIVIFMVIFSGLISSIYS